MTRKRDKQNFITSDVGLDTNLLPASHLLLYQTEDGHQRVEVRLEEETVWMTQATMAELFQTTPQNVTQHLKVIFTEGELKEVATCKEYLQVQTEGDRQVSRARKHYNLEAIIDVGPATLLRSFAG